MDFRKMKLKEIFGSIDFSMVEHRLDNMEKIFDPMQCMKAQKVQFSINMLIGKDGLW